MVYTIVLCKASVHVLSTLFHTVQIIPKLLCTLRSSEDAWEVVQYSAVQYSTAQCSAVRRSTVQCSTMQCSVVQCSTVQYNAVQCGVVS